MVELRAGWMQENTCSNKTRRTSIKIPEIDTLRLGKRELVRQLKKAG
jgi:hypothetical protein